VEDRPFREKSRKPTASAVAAVLGAAAPHHADLVRMTADFAHDWNHSKASGWMLKVHDGKKALFYVLPLTGCFRVTLTVRPDERTALTKDAALAEMHESLRAAKKYAEGYALRFDIADTASFAGFTTFIRRVIALRNPAARR